MTVEKARRHLNQVIRFTSPSGGQGDSMYSRCDTLRRMPVSGILTPQIPLLLQLLRDPKLFQIFFQNSKVIST